MKILIPLLLLTLGVNANEVVYGSKSGTTDARDGNIVKIVDVAAGETIKISNVTGGIVTGETQLNRSEFVVLAQHGELPAMGWQSWVTGGSYGNSSLKNNAPRPAIDDVMVGPCTIHLSLGTTIGEKASWQVSYKITKPSAANTTTSAPILLPPSQDAVQRWFVRLQVSSDLKTWEDVQPGEFLGSDSARFFRIQTSEQ